MRRPAGPSARTVEGMPRRSIERVVPAAPGTRAVAEAVILPAVMLPQPLPTSRVAFSSSVMAATTSSMLSFVSCGCANIATEPRSNAPIAKILFISRY